MSSLLVEELNAIGISIWSFWYFLMVFFFLSSWISWYVVEMTTRQWGSRSGGGAVFRWYWPEACILCFSGGRSCLGPSPSLLLSSPHHHPPPQQQQQQQQQCPHCLKMLSSRQSLLRHIDDRHVVTRPYRCAICGSMCKTKNALQKHHYTYHRGFPLRIIWRAPLLDRQHILLGIISIVPLKWPIHHRATHWNKHAEIPSLIFV